MLIASEVSSLFQEAKLFGVNQDGFYKALIEQIETSGQYDVLDISNRKPYLWILSLFSGYVQLGQFKVNKPHCWKENDLVIVEIKSGKIVSVGTENAKVVWSYD